MAEFFSSDNDRYGDVKWAYILGDMGRYRPISGNIRRYRAILDNIGRFCAISGDIGVISSSVRYVFGKINSSRSGSFNFLVNFVWPCRIRAVTILLETADIRRYR